MTTSDNAATTPVHDDEPGSPIPLAWFSYAAAAAGLSGLVANVINMATHWNDQDQYQSSPEGIDRVAAALGTLSGAVITLLLVSLVMDRGESRRWAIIGAAAYALSYVFRAVLEQRAYSLIG